MQRLLKAGGSEGLEMKNENLRSKLNVRGVDRAANSLARFFVHKKSCDFIKWNKLNFSLIFQSTLDDATDAWGVKVERVEVSFPSSI